MRPHRAFIALAATALFFTGCGGSDTPTTPITNASLAGVYTLRAVNGNSLPAVIQAGSAEVTKIEILSQMVTVNADATWSGIEQFRLTTGATVESQTVNSTGTYTIGGTIVTFKDKLDGSIAEATVSGNTFTLNGGSYVYSK